jgi:hypothetical protein
VQERSKFLVIGHPEGLPHSLTRYAVGLAKRMGYEIVVLSCLPCEGKISKGPEPTNMAISAGRDIASRVEEEGVTARHLVKIGAPGRCIRDVLREVRRVEFVLTGPDGAPSEGMELFIPVFCLSSS